MGLTATFCPWCKCKKKKGLGNPAIFKGDPQSEVKSLEEHTVISWLSNYLKDGPCTAVDKDYKKTVDLNKYSAILSARASEILNIAYTRSKENNEDNYDDFYGSQVVELIADMTTLSLVAAGKRNVSHLDHITEHKDVSDLPKGSFSDLMGRSFIAVILEIEDSVLFRDDGKEDRVDHHIALCGDILTSLWTTLDEYNCPGP